MATTFINYQEQAIGTTTQHMIDGGSPKTTDPTGVAGLDSGKAQIMVGCMVTNILTTSVDATVAIRNTSTSTHLVKGITIPAGDAIEVVQGKVVMEDGDEIEVSASAANALDCVVSVLKNA